jgi:hypothetical protein
MSLLDELSAALRECDHAPSCPARIPDIVGESRCGPCECGYGRAREILEKIKAETKGEDKDPTIKDGFGSEWSKRCPACNQLSMAVMRPGDVQCMNENCPQWKEDK